MDLQIDDGLNGIFDELAETLNISETMREKAERAYSKLGEWIEGNSEGEAAEVYAQGSFALGTVVRPPSGEDLDYDIDLVCQLPGMVEEHCRGDQAVPLGRGLGSTEPMRRSSARRASAAGRSITTSFTSTSFRAPTTPDGEGRRSGSHTKIPETGEYSDKYSNPKGYAKWFEGRMGDSLTEAKRRYAGRVYCSVEDVPTFAVRTPLQKAVQILKHHRNLMFEGADNAPISIIISTLAARAYNGEKGTYDALVGILERMDAYISGGPGATESQTRQTRRRTSPRSGTRNPRRRQRSSRGSIGRGRTSVGYLPFVGSMP